MKINFYYKIILGLLILIPKTTYAINPPVISATGDQTYCPGTSLKIVETISITNDPTDPDTDAIYVQISSGYINGQDLLALANPLLHPTITTSWSSLEGKLKLYSPTGIRVTYSDFEAAIKDVTFTNSSIFPSGTRDFSINLGNGQLSYLPRNKHFYEYVPALGINWTKARDEAAGKNYYGLQGYLATLTAADETQLAGAQAPGAGWIGGSDAATEGTWKWVTGPEAGTTFWIGKGTGATTPPFNYANWNTSGNEPNDSGNEDYAHITAPALNRIGTWNDLRETGDPITNPNYYPQGYIVEYGGMPGDPTLKISASTKITIPKIISTTPSSICGSGVVTLQATATDGAVDWYYTPTGGTSFFTGNLFTTTTLTTTTSYYVDASNGSCPNGPRTEIIATIKALPNAPVIAVSSTSPVLYCLNATAISLSATASTDCILNWYTLPSGGVASTTSPTPTTSVTGSTTYYVSQTNTISGCESPRAAIIVTVNPLPTAPIVSNVNYCNNETAVPLTATASANCTLNWHTTATGGTPSATSPTPSTTTLGSTNYYVSQTITSTGCEGPRAEIIVTINPLPTAPIVSNITYCHNEIASSLTATASVNCTLNWYTNSTGGTSSATSPTPSTATVGTIKYYVSQTITATGCEGPRSEIIVTINPLPFVNDVTITQCDTDLISDGKTLFNLKVNNNLISANYVNEKFTYYTTLNGANNAVPADLIPNELAFENTSPTLMDIYSRISNKITGCASVAKITLKVPATNINPNYKITIPPVCDDFLDVNGNNTANNNNNRDGITTFDFSATKAIILAELPSNQVYDINYYRNKSDALAETNVITDISNYRNIGYPNSQDIWIRIDSDIDNACYGLGPYLTLKAEALPFANPVLIPRQCDDDTDGIFTFNTSTLETDLLKGQNNVTVTYFDQTNNPLEDANGVLISSPFPATFTSTSQTIKAVVTNNTPQRCFDETTIQFIVDDSPVAFAVPSTLTTTCDDEADPIDQDGKFAFDTSTFETTILGGQTGMIVKYYDQNNVLLPGLSNPFSTATQTVTVNVQNPNNTICSASTTLNFVVKPVPNIDLNMDGLDNELVCSNLSTFFATLDAGITDGSPASNYDYIWTKDGIVMSNNFPTLVVNTIGVYTVEVINSFGCSRIRTITVTASNIATIDSIDIVDLTDINTIKVNSTGNGDYEYSLNDASGFWQDSNLFENVPAGIHEVYVKDKNGCGIVNRTVAVVGAPKYFTPNNDGFNDYWSVKGVNQTFNSKSIIYIFNRYGKLLKQWIPNSNQGWDGTFNGIPLPTDDYWFTLILEDGRQAKGHFSLKR